MRNYSEKEIMIIEGVLNLAREGADISSMRSQRIADAAGVGKSTMYDYFKSKDEIVANALIYDFSSHINEFRALISREDSFSEKMHTVLSGLMDDCGKHGHMFSLISAYGGIKSVIPLFKCTGEGTQVMELFDEIYELYSKLLLQGADEGVISLDFSPEYIQSCMTGVMMSIKGSKFFTRSLTTDQAVENAYIMLLKRLN